MASSSVTIRRQKVAHGTYRCSKCGSMVIAGIPVNAEVQQVKSIFVSVSAQEYANREMDEILRKLNADAAARRTLGHLVGRYRFLDRRDSLDNFTLGRGWVESLICSCPVCGHVEPWIKEGVASHEEIEALTDENFPRFSFDYGRSRLRAELKLQDTLESIEQRRKNRAEIDEAAAKLEANRLRYQEIQISLQQKEKNAALEMLRSEKEELGRQRAACKATEFKLKKELANRETSLNARIVSLKDEIAQTGVALMQIKALIECEAEDLRAVISGVSNTLRMIIGNNAVALRLNVNKE